MTFNITPVRRRFDGGSGTGFVQTSITGPNFLLGQPYGLKSIEYCIQDVSLGARVDTFRVCGYKRGDSAATSVMFDANDRDKNGGGFRASTHHGTITVTGSRHDARYRTGSRG